MKSESCVPRSVNETAGRRSASNNFSKAAASELSKSAAPERSIVLRVLDDRARIADDRSVQSELGGDGPCTTVATSRTEHRTNAGLSGPSDRRRCSWTQSTAGIKQGAVDVECQDAVSATAHERSRYDARWLRASGGIDRPDRSVPISNPGKNIVRQRPDRGQARATASVLGSISALARIPGGR